MTTHSIQAEIEDADRLIKTLEEEIRLSEISLRSIKKRRGRLVERRRVHDNINLEAFIYGGPEPRRDG